MLFKFIVMGRNYPFTNINNYKQESMFSNKPVYKLPTNRSNKKTTRRIHTETD